MKLGVVGCGLVWQYEHQPILLKMQEDFPVTAFCAPKQDQEMLDKALLAYPHAATYYDYHDLIADDQVEAVMIATPIQLLEPVALAALDAGKHIFLEKPVALTSAGAKAVLKKAQEKQLLVYVLEQSWYDNCAICAEKLIAQGRLGQILAFDFISHSIIGTDRPERVPYGKTDWRRNPAYKIGTIMDRGIHDLATISYLFNFPVAVCAAGVQVRDTFGKYDRVSILMEYEGGIAATFSHSGVMEGSSNGMRIWGTKGTIHILSDGLALNGVRIIDNNGGVEDIPIANESRRETMWHDLAEHARQKKATPKGVADMMNILKTIEAIEESIETGKRVTL